MKNNFDAQQVQEVHGVRNFTNYAETFNLTSKEIKQIFKEGNPKKIKAFLKVSYPMGDEFKEFETVVVRYGDRKTLATFYLYHDLSPKGEIELIKRDEVNPFIYYTSGHELSNKAFKFLLQNGSPELVGAFLSCNNLTSRQLTMLLVHGDMDYIQIYMDTATGTEREEILRVVTEMNDMGLLNSIYSRCYGVDFLS